MSLVDHSGSVEYPYSKKIVFDAVMAASKNIEGFELDSADEISGHITFKAGVSWSSWGENIPIQLISISPVRTRVEIISTPKTGILFGGANDFGKNRRNIEKIIGAISAQLSGKPAETEQAPQISSISIADELLKLKELKDAEVLNDEEFEKQKNRILEGTDSTVAQSHQNSAPHVTQTPQTEQSATHKQETPITQSTPSEPLVHIEGSNDGMNIGIILSIVFLAIFMIIIFVSI